MRASLLIKLIIASCALFATPAIFAGFSTYSKNWPDDAETVDERISKPEAAEENPEHVTFCTDETDKDNYKPEERICDYKRLYAKVGLTLITAEARKVQNTSLGTFYGVPLANTNARKDYGSWEFGLGTKFQYVRAEIEYIYQKQLPYNSTPLFPGLPYNIQSQLTIQSLWVDLLYDFEKLNLPYFTPYIGGLLGVAWNRTRTTIMGGGVPVASKNFSRICIGWGLTAGIKMPFWTRWYGYLGYKYLDQGMARWLSNNQQVELKAYPITQGLELGVMYLLG